MSLSATTIRCHGCDFKEHIAHSPLTLLYVFPDGISVKSYRVSGWCSQCKGIRDIETALVPSLLKAEIASLQPKRKTLGSMLVSAIGRAFGDGEDDNSKELSRLALLLRIAESRSSPPRCLECGSSNAVELSFDQERTSTNFVHVCGGRLYQVPPNPNAPRFFFHPEIIELDTEGRRL